MPKLKSVIELALFHNANKPLTYTPAASLRPSDLGSECLRRLYYSFFRVPRDLPTKVNEVQLFNSGDAVHTMVKEWLTLAGLSIPWRDENGITPTNRFTGKPDPEFPVSSDKLLIKKGKIDDVIIIKDELWLVEVKSVNDRKFGMMYEANPDHKVQATLYLYLFEENLKKGTYSHIKELDQYKEVKGLIFLYVNRNSGEIKEFDFYKEPDTYNAIVDKIDRLRPYLKAKELPPCEPEKCQYCPFKRRCKADKNID